MSRAITVVPFIAVIALAAWLALSVGAQAAQGRMGQEGIGQEEKRKITDLIKAQMLLSQGEHDKFHEALEKLAQKYPNDADIKNLAQVHHETMHERMQAEEALRQEMMRRQIISSANGD